MTFFIRHTTTPLNRQTQGRVRSACYLYSGCSALLFSFFLFCFLATPTLSFLSACSKETAPSAPAAAEIPVETSPGPIRIRLESPSAVPLPGADIFIYDCSTGALDAYQHWDPTSGEEEAAVLCSSRKIPRTILVVTGLTRDWEWGQIRSIDALREHLVSLDEEEPEAGTVLSGESEIGDGFDEACTVTLRPLLCRIRLRSLCCDFSGRPYEGESLKNLRVYLTGAGSETVLFPDEAVPPLPTAYRNMGSDCGELPVLSWAEPVGTLALDGTQLGALYCYPNPATEEGLGTPLTRLVIEGELLGRTWYYPITLPPLQRNRSYDFDVTLTMTGATDPEIPVDGSSATLALEVTPWVDHPAAIVPFLRETPVYLSSADPSDPDRISDLNLFVYTGEGILQEQRFIPERFFQQGKPLTLRLLEPLSYTVVACANLGYALPEMGLDALRAYRYHLAYPDEYSRGLPMSGMCEGFTAGSAPTLNLPLTRLLARISLEMDRSCLSSDVSMDVRSVRIGNCPRSVSLFGESRVETEEDLFLQGFHKEGVAVDPLNLLSRTGRSESIDLYVLENVQGKLLDDDTPPRDKVLSPPECEVASFIELHLDYQSDSYYSDLDHYLIYRFYPGESGGDFSLRRGHHYSFTITPEDEGLDGDPWRIDRSRLGVRTRFELHPAAYNECSSAESYHIWCEVSPPSTPMTIEPLAYDDDERVADLYDYDIDRDGHGITIHPRKGGTALVYFSAGPPISRDTLALLRIDP